jgi:chromosome segregation ATPase
MTKHSEKIFRTVVFAGAMLGAPLVSADAPQKPTKAPEQKKVDTVDSLTKEIAAVDVEIKKATDAVANAQNQADRDAAKAKLDQRRKQKAELEKKLAELKKSTAPQTPLQKLEQELADTQLKIDTAIAAVTDAQNDADRKAAKAKLASLQKDKTEIEKKIAAEKQKLARPRTPENDRPIGRGFVLA